MGRCWRGGGACPSRPSPPRVSRAVRMNRRAAPGWGRIPPFGVRARSPVVVTISGGVGITQSFRSLGTLSATWGSKWSNATRKCLRRNVLVPKGPFSELGMAGTSVPDRLRRHQAGAGTEAFRWSPTSGRATSASSPPLPASLRWGLFGYTICHTFPSTSVPPKTACASDAGASRMSEGVDVAHTHSVSFVGV